MNMYDGITMDISEPIGTFGDMAMTLESIEDITSIVQPEISGEWLEAKAVVSYHDPKNPYSGCSGDVQLSIRCWSDVDDDNADWCVANEGARIIEACVTGTEGDDDTRGDFLRLACSEDCHEIGVAACKCLRDAAIEIRDDYLRELAESDDWRDRRNAAQDPNLPDDMVSVLAEDDDEDVRRAIAERNDEIR